MPSIEMNSVNKEYDNGQAKLKILNNCSYVFEEHMFYSVIGRSGLGKTTLLRILGTIESPDDGEILIDGKSILNRTEKNLANLRCHQIGFIFQNYCLVDRYTIEENLVFPLFFKGIREKEVINKQIATALELVNIDKDMLKQTVSSLSGGEKQRVAIARALINNPNIIFADEPTGNLDTKNEQVVINSLKRISQDLGKTIIMVTHNLELAQKADRIITLQEGKIINIGE